MKVTLRIMQKYGLGDCLVEVTGEPSDVAIIVKAIEETVAEKLPDKEIR